MKVILLKDDKSLGKRGTIVTVSDGFAFNNLIPRGIAKTATPQVIREAQQREKQQRADMAAAQSARRAHAATLHKKKITLSAKAKGVKLFGSITAKDIAAAIVAQHNIDVTDKMIVLDAPIKEITTREIPVNFGDAITAHVILTVTPL